MKTILWIYSKPLKPEAGGTERITSLVQRGLTKAGYHCMDILELDVIKLYIMQKRLRTFMASSKNIMLM